MGRVVGRRTRSRLNRVARYGRIGQVAGGNRTVETSWSYPLNTRTNVWSHVASTAAA